MPRLQRVFERVLTASDRLHPMLRRVARDRRGATAVEFGLVAVPTLFTLLAIFEIGFNFFMVAALDNAANQGARQIMTGAVSTAGLTANKFQTQVVCPTLPSMFNCSNVFINVTIAPSGMSPSGYYTYVNASQSALNAPSLSASQSTFCPGSGDQYVVLQIQYPLPFFTSIFSSGATTTYNGQKVRVLMSTATFKNEPFAGAQTYTGC